MRRILYSWLVLCVLFALLAACGADSSTDDANAEIVAAGNKGKGHGKPTPPPPVTGIGILEWTPNPITDNVVQYHIYRSTVSGGNVKGVYFATVDGTITTFSDTTGYVGTTYYYVLTADNGLESEFSNEASKMF